MSASSSYVASGLRIEASAPLPGLRPAARRGAPDLRLALGPLPASARHAKDARPWYVSPLVGDTGKPVVSGWIVDEGRSFHLVYPCGAEFAIDRAATRAWLAWPSRPSLESAVSYVLGPILALALRLRGIVCLHASAIAVGDHAVAFVGASNTGKSTVAMLLAGRGHAVLADDLVALDRDGECLIARPCVPWIRLRRSAVVAMHDVLAPTAGARSVWNPEFVDVEMGRQGLAFQAEPLPLAAVYLVATTGSAPVISPASPSSAFLELLAETWGSAIVDPDSSAQQLQLGLLGELVSKVAVKRLRWSGRACHVSALRDLLVDDLRRGFEPPGVARR